MRSEYRELIISTIALLMVAIVASVAVAQATTYAGVTFPLGDLSFADRAISYVAASCVDRPYADASAALGPPDCCGNACQSCAGCDPCAVALGFRLSELDARGSLVLEFTDNILRNVAGDDLFVYITNDKLCRVEISTDGSNYILVGEVAGYPAAIDIAPFVSSEQTFRFVRLSDVPADEDRSPCPGPSIDAVGAMGDPVAVQERGVVLGSLELLPAGTLALSVGGGALQNLLIIFDTSSSMSWDYEDSTKIVIAKSVLSDLIANLPDGMKVGLRVFGRCNYSKRLLLVGLLDREQLHATIVSITTGGKTPLAYTLEQAKKDFTGITGNKLILLVTDGVDTCGGDPKSVAEGLVKGVPNLRIDVVGFDVAQYGRNANDELRGIAEGTHGTYYDAESSKQLQVALQSILGVVRYEVFDSHGTKVFDGVLGEPGPQLPPETYRVVLLTNPTIVRENVIVKSGETTQYEVIDTGAGYTIQAKQ